MKKIKLIYLVILLVMLLAFNLYASEKLTNTKGQLEVFKKMQEEGYLKLEPELNKAYVHPAMWGGLTFETKKDFAAGLAIYCGNYKKNDLYWVEIYDLFSGKKLAKFSQSWGFKVY